MMMRLFYILLICVLFGCKPKNEEHGVNLVVTEKSDTLSVFNYTNDNLEKYKLFDKDAELDSVIESKEAQKKLIGKYHFGFRSKTHSINRLLGFRDIPITKLALAKDSVMPFLNEELNLYRNYEIKLITNYIDSTGGQPRRTEMQIALDRTSGDTLMYQEASYSLLMPDRKQLVLTLLLYDNLKNRNEMLDFLDDVKMKINRYRKR